MYPESSRKAIPKKHEHDQRYETEHAADTIDHAGNNHGFDQPVGNKAIDNTAEPAEKGFQP
jgi:hypothetical protein